MCYLCLWQSMRLQKIKKMFMVFLFFIIGIASAFSQMSGDVNSDGAVNIIDALATAQYYVGMPVSNFNAANADVNRDSQVNILDALMIAQYSVGLITSFPTPTPTSALKAAFTISNAMPALNAPVTFDASGSTGSIASYSWDFDDGTGATGIRVTHAFTTPDDYKVKLTVKDSNGLIDKISIRIFAGRPQGWTQETHSKSADGNYSVVFDEETVKRLDIVITSANFRTMEDDLARWNLTTKPVYVPVTVKFNGITWWNVGMRYKGQSSLLDAKQKNKHKYPFHLNFDKFEDDYPEINNQRFYGFKELLGNSNWYDSCLIKDLMCADIIRDGGVPAARGAFYRVFVDTGNGPVYWGLYTIFEDHGDEMLKTQFSDSNGNLYKPEKTGADWSTYVESAFVKKTNEEEADYSDVKAAVTALHASRTDAAAWRQGLEATFNVNIFLRWLAINTTIVNIDSYGIMAQNYFLYQDLADNGRLVWIPWDFHLAFNWAYVIGITPLSFSLSEVRNNWPLIRFLIDDPVYRDFYHQEMRKALTGCFNETNVKAKMQRLHNMVRPYVIGTEGETSDYSYLTNGATEFDKGLTDLLNHVSTRQTAAQNYLATIP